MPDIVISEFMDQKAVDSLAADFDVVYDPQLVDRYNDLLAAVVSARALVVCNRTQVRGELLRAASGLCVVGHPGVGLDNIDVAVCRERGVRVCPATGANDTAVAEYVIATALTILRGAYGVIDAVIGGHWPRQACIGREIAGKVLGLVGFGGIARETAQRALALGMDVIALDPEFFSGGSFEERLETLTAAMLLQDGVRLPGTRRLAARKSAEANGLEVPKQLYAKLQNLR